MAPVKVTTNSTLRAGLLQASTPRVGIGRSTTTDHNRSQYSLIGGSNLPLGTQSPHRTLAQNLVLEIMRAPLQAKTPHAADVLISSATTAMTQLPKPVEGAQCLIDTADYFVCSQKLDRAVDSYASAVQVARSIQNESERAQILTRVITGARRIHLFDNPFLGNLVFEVAAGIQDLKLKAHVMKELGFIGIQFHDLSLLRRAIGTIADIGEGDYQLRGECLEPLNDFVRSYFGFDSSHPTAVLFYKLAGSYLNY